MRIDLEGRLELGLGAGVSGVEVGVVSLGERAVGALELLVTRQPLHPEDRVIVAFIHGSSKATRVSVRGCLRYIAFRSV